MDNALSSFLLDMQIFSTLISSYPLSRSKEIVPAFLSISQFCSDTGHGQIKYV